MDQKPLVRVNAIVPMIHVASVERSATFYRLFGLEIGHRIPATGAMQWAWLYSVDAADWKLGPNVMLARAEREIEAGAQQILFYMYAPELESLRAALLAGGVSASEISYPEYLPKGEFRVIDPDGYMLMVAQSAHDTP